MRTIRTKVYQFSELSEQAKQKAIENYRNSNTEIFWADENRESLKEFAKLFPIIVTDWSYGGRGEGVSFRFTECGEIENLTGQRLATYLWNNYNVDIYSKKYYSIHENGSYKSRYSKIQSEPFNCPLTGYCMDNELLSEIWDFINKPDSRNFKDLLEDCFSEWIKACNADIEDQNSDENITSNIEANEYEFTIDGKRF